MNEALRCGGAFSCSFQSIDLSNRNPFPSSQFDVRIFRTLRHSGVPGALILPHQGRRWLSKEVDHLPAAS
jgi:hypothetical protein